MYLSVGVGVVSNSTDATQDVTLTDFAWSLGTGFSKSLSDSLTTDLRYRYVDLGKVGTGIEVTFGIRANF